MKFILDAMLSDDWHRQLKAIKWCRAISIGALMIPIMMNIIQYGVRPDEPRWVMLAILGALYSVAIYFYYRLYRHLIDRHWQKPFEKIAGNS